ncbi:MAG: hypothetical protein E1N59_2567 [Puniceicoccaceae bacterium 5H]|nr:MAG: hypothetical protein E1N59_2567 [Puniceicoccaceae bacterium 5H]
MQTTLPDLRTAIGFDSTTCSSVLPDKGMIEYINMQLAALGEPIFGKEEDYAFLKMGQSLMAHYQAKDQLRDKLRPPSDRRIEEWLHQYLQEVEGAENLHLPGKTFSLGQHGLSRMLSLPPDRDEFHSDIVHSYRIANGVLHNPKSDRRTTKGVFHVTEGGLPIPEDKKAVPKKTFAKLLEHALQPPSELMRLPFTSTQKEQARCWVSLLLRPVVCPAVPGFTEQKSMEVRFFAPGNLVCNLDFVESIFGNAGDPYLHQNDAGLDIKNWSGHTGCVILAPHLLKLTKKEVGLPHISEANERQKRDGMCWENEDELYNDGQAYKVTARDENGVIVTLISDNYFGYCKKEVKTQLSYASNLYGLVEEEHAGGALAFSSYDLGEDFRLSDYMPEVNHTFEDVVRLYAHRMELQPEGYGIDLKHPNILYVPEDAYFSLPDQKITWRNAYGERSIKLLARKTYVLPSGYKVRLMKPAEGRRWRLIGTRAQPTMSHKPCTVSGGGKSEISKSIADAIIHNPFYVDHIKEAFDKVDEILGREYGNRFRDASKNRAKGRPILSPERSLGSVIKLLNPSDEYTEEHNAFIRGIPTEIKELVLLVKRFYKPDWGDNWRDRFAVDRINGVLGHELRYRGAPIIASYLRLGYEEDGSWRVFTLRKDFWPAAKIQMEDDITASVVVPREQITGTAGSTPNPSLKFTYNCEYRLFQRPDDAIIRGYDHQTERDLSQKGNFLSNYEPLGQAEAREIVDDAVRFDYFTGPMKAMLQDFVENPEENPNYISTSAIPRIIDGKFSKNPRYLQTRPGLEAPEDIYLAQMGLRFFRRLREEEPVHTPVDIVCPGHRNNPPEGSIRSLAVLNPIHYMPLPEAFMEFISSMTGKSPSTTGAGSEGALTKGPFNAILPIHDINAAFVSYAVTGYQPFVTSAAYVGPKFRVDHDISLLVPEIWSRMKRIERDPNYLIENGLLDKVEDMEVNGKKVPASILGYRINQNFVNLFMGRVFGSPGVLFTEEMLKPELQDLETFADGIANMMGTHQRVAANYFADGSYERAVPPIKALLHIMRDGEYEGKTLASPELRAMFTREAVLESDWYKARLDTQQASDVALMESHLQYLTSFPHDFAGLAERRAEVEEKLAYYKSEAYRASIVGTIGRDPSIGIV